MVNHLSYLRGLGEVLERWSITWLSYLGGLGEVLGEGAGEMVLGGTGGGTSRRFIAGESNGEPRSRTRELTARACRVVAHPSWTKGAD